MKTETIKISEREGVSLTTYLLDKSDEMKHMEIRPAVLVLPGGAYKFCSDREAEPVAMEFLAKGYNAFILRYSVNDNAAFPNPLNEAEDALEMIRNNADEWGVDANKIAVIGFSAGGHLAAALATMGRVRPNALILGYPCILESISNILAAPIESVDEKVTAETPPTFIFAASNDRGVPIIHSIKFAEALDSANVPFEMHIFGNGGHGFSLATEVVCADPVGCARIKPVSRWIKMCFDWLDKIFKNQ